ncbi:MAG: glycerophosphodiester phosphodiesterase family protein [Fulvivirga sp.]|uniref:glycerophosphodiester phosphodiesterase family protein n=1 Tax=Fulvivirga sp. TaxID=1931237 RepID=UPI0032EE1FA5
MYVKNILGFLLCFSLIVSCQNIEKGTVEKQSTPVETDEVERTSISFDAWFTNPQPLVSAHRGGPYPGYPENAIETFEYIANQVPFVIIECDVSMTKDSILVLMHDKTLDRTTTGTGNISDYMFSELAGFKLVDNEGQNTIYQIPTLDQALVWGKNKALFTLDVKRGVPFEKVLQAIEKYNAEDYAAIITYRIQDAILIHSLNSEVIVSVSARDKGALKQIRDAGIPNTNLLGFVGTSEPDSAHYKQLHELGIKTILGTLGNLDNSAVAKGDDTIYKTYISNGANIIATDRPIEVANVLYEN